MLVSRQPLCQVVDRRPDLRVMRSSSLNEFDSVRPRRDAARGWDLASGGITVARGLRRLTSARTVREFEASGSPVKPPGSSNYTQGTFLQRTNLECFIS